jgi:hypothetical protein
VERKKEKGKTEGKKDEQEKKCHLYENSVLGLPEHPTCDPILE